MDRQKTFEEGFNAAIRMLLSEEADRWIYSLERNATNDEWAEFLESMYDLSNENGEIDE